MGSYGISGFIIQGAQRPDASDTRKIRIVNTALYASAASLALIAPLAATGAQAQSRDQIRIVGSSTVFPYTQAVAEEFTAMTGGAAPVVEGTGTGGGMQIFCGGVGVDFPDITGASRAMTQSEYDTCLANGVD